MSNNLFFGYMIASKFNFVVSAAIFASTIYFLWVKIKRKTGSFSKDDSSEVKSLKISDDEEIIEESQLTIVNVVTTLEENYDVQNAIESSISKDQINILNEEYSYINNQIDCEATNRMNYNETMYGSLNNSVNSDFSSQMLTQDSIIKYNAMDDSLEDMLCNNLKVINLNLATTKQEKSIIEKYNKEIDESVINDEPVTDIKENNNSKVEVLVIDTKNRQYITDIECQTNDINILEPKDVDKNEIDELVAEVKDTEIVNQNEKIEKDSIIDAEIEGRELILEPIDVADKQEMGESFTEASDTTTVNHKEKKLEESIIDVEIEEMEDREINGESNLESNNVIDKNARGESVSEVRHKEGYLNEEDKITRASVIESNDEKEIRKREGEINDESILESRDAEMVNYEEKIGGELIHHTESEKNESILDSVDDIENVNNENKIVIEIQEEKVIGEIEEGERNEISIFNTKLCVEENLIDESTVGENGIGYLIENEQPIDGSNVECLETVKGYVDQLINEIIPNVTQLKNEMLEVTSKIEEAIEFNQQDYEVKTNIALASIQSIDEADSISDISQSSESLDDSPLENLMVVGNLMEYIEDCLNDKESEVRALDSNMESNCKLENWQNDEDSLNNIKRDFYEISTHICSPHPSSESDHAHCVNNLTERVAILTAESILDSQGHINSSDSELTPTLSSPTFDESNPELYVEKITCGGKELDVVYFEEAVLAEGGVQTDVKIVRTIPVGLGGRIIGKKGKTKNELMKKYGAQLLIYNHPMEIGKQVLEITCNPSVSGQLEKWVNKTLDQITKSTIQTTVSNPEWLKPMIPLGRLVVAHIVDMPTIQHIKLRIYDLDNIKAFNTMQKEMNADYGHGDNTSLLPRPVAIGCVCVAMIRPDYFLRAQIIEIYEDIAWVYLYDIGKVCQTYLFYLFKIREKYMRIPFQVIPARMPHALIKNKNLSAATIYKRFLCDQKTMKPKMVRVFFPRMNTCCEPCVNIYVPMSTVSETNDNKEEFIDLLELLVSVDICSMVRETINSEIQVKINTNHFKAFLNEKDKKRASNVPVYFQPCNSKFYEDFIEFNNTT